MKSFTAFNEMVSNKKQKEAIENAKLDRKSALKVASKTYKEDTELEEGLKQARKNVGMDPDKPSCWKGYKATGTKMKGGKQVPDCKKEEVELEEKKNCNHSKKGVECDEHGTEDCTDKVEEGTKYGLYKGSGKAGGAMKAFLDKRAKKLEAEKKKQKPEYRNNPAFGDASHHSNAKNRTEGADIADILARLEKKRISKGGDPKDSPLPAMKKYHADKAKKKIKESVEKEKEEADGTPSSVEEEIKMTRKAYNKLHKDFKSDDPKKPRTTKYVPGKGTVSMPVKFVDEAKVDQGRSDYGKASIRNYRRMGPGHGDPGMFDPEGKRGKTIDKRREEHKARRGVKGAKVPAYKVESAAGYSIGGEIKKGMKRHKDAVKKRKEKSGKAVPYAMLAQEYVPEEGYDHWRDKQLEKGTWKEPERTNPPRKPMTKKELEKQSKNSQKALDIVKKGILKKYGKGAIMEPKTKKEEVELQELSRSTLSSYIQKGARDIAGKANDASIKGMSGKRKEADKGYEKTAKRVRGVSKAGYKLALKEMTSYKDFIKSAQAARDRVKKKQEDKKKKDAQYSDMKKRGIKFYDKKGSGRLVGGKKKYD